jgi:hypothetical protein
MFNRPKIQVPYVSKNLLVIFVTDINIWTIALEMRVKKIRSEIRGARRSVIEVFALLGCNSALLVVSYTFFGTAYKVMVLFLTARPLKMGPTGLPRRVGNYHLTLRIIPEQPIPQFCRFHVK